MGSAFGNRDLRMRVNGYAVQLECHEYHHLTAILIVRFERPQTVPIYRGYIGAATVIQHRVSSIYETVRSPTSSTR